MIFSIREQGCEACSLGNCRILKTPSIIPHSWWWEDETISQVLYDEILFFSCYSNLWAIFCWAFYDEFVLSLSFLYILSFHEANFFVTAVTKNSIKKINKRGYFRAFLMWFSYEMQKMKEMNDRSFLILLGFEPTKFWYFSLIFNLFYIFHDILASLVQ